MLSSALCRSAPPLSNSVRVNTVEDNELISVHEYVVGEAVRAIKTSRAGGPDDLPNWVLKAYTGILAAPIVDVLDWSFSKCKVPTTWKLSDVPPVPKASSITDFNKYLYL